MSFQRFCVATFLNFVIVSALVPVAVAQQPSGHPIIVKELAHDVSPPLRDIEPVVPRRGPAHQIPLLRPSPGSGPLGLYVDPLLQTTLGPAVATSSGNNFDGVADTSNAQLVAPPDTNGAVGATQYVQWVNSELEVFDKSTGAHIYGPVAGTTIWSGFSDANGNACSVTNDGDILAQYDKVANRWVLAQLSYSNAPPYLLCLAVSTTSDATGSYNRYSLSYSGNLNDYPKLGVWPDAYYVTANMFTPTNSLACLLGIGPCYQFAGPEVCALNRANMLSGGSSTPVCKGPLSTSFSSLLPSDLDGTTQPPAGSPNYLLGLGGSGTLYLWKFHVDFANTGNSTLTGPTSISVGAFNQACGGGTCIPQAGTTQQLDSLGDRLMYRLAYRNQGGTEILLANHSVATTVGGSSTVGVRWYEIHNPNGTPTVAQQATWAPDATYRWMGSIAMDHSGNIALGYSASSGSIHPAIRYTGRQSTDTLGTMAAENSIIEGAGSQTGGLSRWGDYSAMSVDPVDDCTFYYTNEYLQGSGSFNWNTRIASFKFSNCGGSTSSPDFSISPSPASQTITAGGNTSYGLTLTSLNSYTGSVTLTVASGCPAGATCGIAPSPVNVPSGGSNNSTLSVTGGTAAAGSYTLTVNATDGTLTHQTSVTLVVQDYSLTSSPSSASVTQGNGTNYTVTASSLDGYADTVNLIVSACPTGLTCTLTSGSISVASGGSGNSTLTVSTTSTTPTGPYNISVTGTGATSGIQHTTTVTLTVNAPAAGDFSISASPSSRNIKRGSTTSYTVTISSLNGFTGNIGLTVSGCPSGSSCTLSPTTVTGGSGSSVLAVITANTSPAGTYSLTITGTSGALVHSTAVTLKLR